MAYSLVQLTVQCCIQTVCCGIQFGSADSTVLYTDSVVWFQLALQVVTFNCCYSMSVIQLTESCIVINFADIYG